MDEIIRHILEAPSLTFSKNVLEELKYLIDRMDPFTFTLAEFQRIRAIYKPKPPLSQFYADVDVIKKTDQYIAAWEKIFRLIEILFHQIKFVSHRIKTSNFGADDNLPIVIKLIPNSRALLELLALKLSTESHIIRSNKCGYVIVDLMVAVFYKLGSPNLKRSKSLDNLHRSSAIRGYHQQAIDEREPNLVNQATEATQAVQSSHLRRASASDCRLYQRPKFHSSTALHPDDQPDLKYNRVAAIISDDLKLSQFAHEFQNLCYLHYHYQLHIDSEIQHKLYTEASEICEKYYHVPKNEISAHVVSELIDSPLITSALKSLIHKYLAVEDIGHTLGSKHKSLKFILTQFIEKFKFLESTLIQPVNKFTVNPKSAYSYLMLLKYTAELVIPKNDETRFIHAANEFTQRAQDYMLRHADNIWLITPANITASHLPTAYTNLTLPEPTEAISDAALAAASPTIAAASATTLDVEPSTHPRSP